MRFLAGLLFLGASADAFACSCQIAPEPEAFAHSKAVFLVRVLKTELIRGERERVQAQFEVLETFKGNAQSVKKLETSTDMCQLTLIVGAQYLIYSDGEVTKTIGACGNSRWFEANKEAAWLNEHRKK